MNPKPDRSRSWTKRGPPPRSSGTAIPARIEQSPGRLKHGNVGRRYGPTYSVWPRKAAHTNTDARLASEIQRAFKPCSRSLPSPHPPDDSAWDSSTRSSTSRYSTGRLVSAGRSSRA